MTNRRTPDLFVEQAQLGERPVAAEDADRVALLAESNAEILRRYPPRVVAVAVASRVPVRSAQPWFVFGAVLVAATLSLVVIGAPGRIDPTHPMEDGIRLKGLEPTLHVHRVTRAGAAPVAPDSRLASGDVLQLSYVAGEAQYGVVLSIDGRGVVTGHLPVEGDTARPLSAEGTVALDTSYALDDAPDFERFFFVTSESAFPVRSVFDAAQTLVDRGAAETDALPIDDALTQTSFLVRKVVNR